MQTKIIGNNAERQALKYLKNKGLTLIEKNYFTKIGEIDLIMLDTDCLVFVEVRFRTKGGYLLGFETITTTKQQHLIRTAKYFIRQNPRYQNFLYRFDIVSIQSNLKYAKTIWQGLKYWRPTAVKIDWIQNAIKAS